MFHKEIHYHESGPKSIYQHTDIHEHRAPTDESIKLLREMEIKAQEQVIKSYNVADNKFNCLVQTIKNAANGQVKFRAIFDLNGHRMVEDYDANEFDTRYSLQKVLKNFLDKIAKRVALEILMPALDKLDERVVVY